MIPARITQTWKSRELPAAAQALAAGWRQKNPAMEWRLFDDAACEALVADVAPEHLEAYRAFPYPVMRADYFRYAAIYRDGGLYADVDMQCLRPVGPLLGLAPMLLATEAHLTEMRRAELGYARPLQIANCVFAAVPRHPFLRLAMDRVVALAARSEPITREQIEDVSGPRMLTRLFFEAARSDVAVLRQVVLMAPRHYPDVWPLNASMHARHLAFGSWKERRRRSPARLWIERDRWPNPFPAGLLDRSLAAQAPAAPARAASA